MQLPWVKSTDYLYDFSINIKHGIFLSGFFVVVMGLLVFLLLVVVVVGVFLLLFFVVVAFVVVVFVFVCVCVSGGPIMLKQNQDLELCNDNCWNLVKHHNNNKNYFTTDHKKKKCRLFPCLSKIGAIK